MKQVLDLAHPLDLPHGVLDVLDLLWIVELSAQGDNAAIGVHADLPLGNRPVAEQLAFDLAHKADIVQVRTMVTMRDRVRETDDLARLVVRAAFHYPFGGRAFRERIGIVLESAGIDAELTVREVLDCMRPATHARCGWAT